MDAVAYFNSALSVIPVTASLSFDSSVTWPDSTCFGSGAVLPFICCNSILPASAKPPQSFTGTDFIIYITKRPTLGSVLAWALPCFQDNRQYSYGRPVLGQANFSPAQLSTNPSAYHQQLTTAIHEMTHALGFTSSKFGQFINPVTGNTLPYSSIIFSGVRASLCLLLPCAY